MSNLVKTTQSIETWKVILCFTKYVNPIRPGLFSHSPGPRGGSEARMPNIKVNINGLKLNFAWVIISIKAFLMQNLRLIALLVLEI